MSSGGAGAAGAARYLSGLLLALGLLALPAAAQIDPLVYAPVTGTRATLRFAHTVDTFVDGATGGAWRDDASFLQVAVERPIAPAWVATFSVAASGRALRAEGGPGETAWALDHLGLALAHPSRPGWLDGHLTLVTKAAVPLDPPHTGPVYTLEAATVWLSDPLALEVEAGLTVRPTGPPVYGLGGGVTFVANRHYSLAAQVAVEDLLGLPAASLWVSLHRQPAVPGPFLWGVGLEYRVDEGRTAPGVHLLLSVDL